MASEINSSDSTQPFSSINVTPFVDVVLVLLVIFIITAPTIMKDSLLIQLPKSSTSDSKSVTNFGVAITTQGQVLLNGIITDDNSLSESLKIALQKDSSTQVLISADANSKHSDLVHVIDVIKKSGVTRFALQVQHE